MTSATEASAMEGGAGERDAAVEFFFDCSCPWTYLAFVRLRESAVRTGSRIAYRPILLARILAAVSPALAVSRVEPNPVRARYQAKDLADWARFCGLRIHYPEPWPVRTEWAQRGAVVANRAGTTVAYLTAVFTAHFDAGRNISELPVIVASAVAAGMAATEFEALVGTPETLAEVNRNSDQLLARGGFGSPTMFVGDDMYVGNDRMPLVETALLRARGTRFVMPGEHSA